MYRCVLLAIFILVLQISVAQPLKPSIVVSPFAALDLNCCDASALNPVQHSEKGKFCAGLKAMDMAIMLLTLKNDSALHFIDVAVKLFSEDTREFIKASRIKARILRSVLHDDSATTSLLTRIKPVAERMKYYDELIAINNGLAISFTLEGNYGDAFKLHYENLAILQTYESKEDLRLTLANIGLVFYKMRSYTRAISYYRRCLNVIDRRDVDNFIILCSNLSLAYGSTQNIDSAFYFYRMATSMANVHSGEVNGELVYALGYAYLKKAQFQESQIELNRALPIFRKVRDQRMEAECLLGLSQIHFSRMENDQGWKKLRECGRISKDKGYLEILLEAYRLNVTQYLVEGSLKDACLYQDSVIETNGRLYGATTSRYLANAQSKFYEDKLGSHIALQRERMQKHEEIANWQSGLTILILCLAIFFVILVGSILRRLLIEKTNSDLLSLKVESRSLLLNECSNNLLRKNEIRLAAIESCQRVLSDFHRCDWIRNKLNVC